MENTQTELTIKQLSEDIVILKTEGKAKDREIKELKEQMQTVINSQTKLESTNQIVLNELKHINSNIEDVKKNVTDEMKPIKDYIEQLKQQPQRDKNDFIKMVLSAVVVSIVGAIGYMVGLKK